MYFFASKFDQLFFTVTTSAKYYNSFLFERSKKFD
jgi:hypothetical protein